MQNLENSVSVVIDATLADWNGFLLLLLAPESESSYSGAHTYCEQGNSRDGLLLHSKHLQVLAHPVFRRFKKVLFRNSTYRSSIHLPGSGV